MPGESRRIRYNIVAEILETARGGATKTHIMHETNLSYEQVCEYISLLVEKGFLENCKAGKRRQMKHLLKTTKQGEKFLKNIMSINLLLDKLLFEAPPK